jgi:predicted CXXCH cytochrome family protein
MSQKTFAFSSADEFRAHAKDSVNCVTEQCHQAYGPLTARFFHAPVLTGECGICHKAEGYPRQYGLAEDQVAVCRGCHTKMVDTVQLSQYIHGPIKEGDCVVCHDPHGTEQKFLLRESYNNLCSICHNPVTYSSGTVVHQPVRDGNCGICHDPHASNERFRLTDVGANLCLSCHAEMMEIMTKGYMHTPLVESGCSGCHDPHSGNDKLRLRETPETMCFTCHTDKKNEIEFYTNKHQPALEGKCTFCHSSHAASDRNLLRKEIDSLCYACHEEKEPWKTMEFQHGPVIQGNCTACHNPHGSDNSYILRLQFPEKFYTQYEEGKYGLCFLCHQEALITVDETETITLFRNGRVNLHSLHVKQKKGRTCRACHDVHASNEEHHIREEFQFGKMSIPIYYFKTTSGGRCIPGCHKERAYDRLKMVINEN